MIDKSIDLEKHLRRIEVKRLFDDARGVFTPDELVEISEAFMARAKASGDWRFLNTALKLNDSLRASAHPRVAWLSMLEGECLAIVRRECGLQ